MTILLSIQSTLSTESTEVSSSKDFREFGPIQIEFAPLPLAM